MEATAALLTLSRTLLLFVMILFATSQAQPCDSLTPVGIADPNIIPDNRIVTSSEAEGHGKEQIRLNCCQGTYGNAWCPDPKDKHPFVEIHLERPVVIGLIDIQAPTVDAINRQFHVNFLKTFDLLIKLPGVNQLARVAQDVSAIENKSVSVNSISLYPTILTDVIRIEPKDSENWACFRMELYRCDAAAMCPLNYCQNNGTCSQPYSCDCPDFFYGEKCQYSKETVPMTVYEFLQISDNKVITGSHSLTIHGSVSLDDDNVLALPPGSFLDLVDFSQGSCFSDVDKCLSGFTIHLVFSVSQIDTNPFIVLTNGAVDDPRVKGITLLLQQGHLYSYVSTSEKIWTVVQPFELTEATWYKVTISWSLNLGLIVLNNRNLIGSAFIPQSLDTLATQANTLTLGSSDKISSSVLHFKEITMAPLDWQEFQRAELVTVKEELVDRSWDLRGISQSVIESHDWLLTVKGKPTFGEDGVMLTKIDQDLEISNLSNSCLTNPTACKDGLTFKISIKLSTLEEDSIVFTSGGEYTNHPGVTLLYRYGQFHAIVSTESYSWFVSVSRETILTNHFCDIILSWRQHRSLKLFINQVLVGESASPIYHPNTTLPHLLVDRITIGNGIIGSVISEIHIWQSHLERLCQLPIISILPCNKPTTTSPTTSQTETTTPGQYTRKTTTESTDEGAYYDECPPGCIRSDICFGDYETPTPAPTSSCDLSTQSSSPPTTVEDATTQQKTSPLTAVTESTQRPSSTTSDATSLTTKEPSTTAYPSTTVTKSTSPSSPSTVVTNSTSETLSSTTKEPTTATSTTVPTTKPPCPLPTTCPQVPSSPTTVSSSSSTTVTDTTVPQTTVTQTSRDSTTGQTSNSTRVTDLTTQETKPTTETDSTTKVSDSTSKVTDSTTITTTVTDLTTSQPTTVTYLTTPQPTTVTDSTTQQPTTVANSTTQHPTTPQPTTVSGSTTQQPTTVTDSTTPQPTTVTDSTTPQPTTVTDSTTPQPTTPQPTTPQPTTVTDSTTPQPTTPKCTSSSSCPPYSTTKQTTVTDSPTSQQTTVTDSPTTQPTTPQPTTVTDSTTPQPTTVTDSTTPQPTTVADSTTPQPTTVTDSTTPQPTTVADSTTPQPTTRQPTAVTDSTTPQPTTPPATTVTDTTTPQPTTEQQTTVTDSTTPQPTTPKCTSSSSCPPASTTKQTTETDLTTPQKTTVTDSTTPQLTTRQPTSVTNSTTPQPPASEPTTVTDSTTKPTTASDSTTSQPSTSQPTTVTDSTTPQHTTPKCTSSSSCPPQTTTNLTTVTDSTTKQPTALTDSTTSQSTTVTNLTTSQPTTSQSTTVTESTTLQTTSQSPTVRDSTTVKDSTILQSTTVTDSTTPELTTPKCTSSSSCPPQSTTQPTPVTDSPTPRPTTPQTTTSQSTTVIDSTTVKDSTTPQSTTVRDSTTSQSTTVTDSTTPQPTTPKCTSSSSCPPQSTTQPTTVTDSTTPQLTTVTDSTTPQPATVTDSPTSQPTTLTDSPTSQPTTITDSPTSQPTTVTDSTTPQPTTPKCTSSSSCPPQSTTQPTTVRDSTTSQLTTTQPTEETESTTPQPTTPEPTTPQPTTPQPTTQQPTTPQPTTPQPTTTQPTEVTEPTTPQPTTPQPTTQQPTTPEPTTPQPTTTRPTTPEPTTPEPTTPEPTTPEPTTPEPTTPQPATPQPTTPTTTTTETTIPTSTTTTTTKSPCPPNLSSVTLTPDVNSNGQGQLTCSVAAAPEPGIRIKFTWKIVGSTVQWSKEIEAPDRSASISASEINVSILNKQITCTAEVRYTTSNAEWCSSVKSNVVIPSIKCPPINGTIKVIEGREQQFLQIQVTVPPSLLCRPEDNGQCRVEVSTTITSVLTDLRCSVKEIIPQAVLGVSTVGQSGSLSCGVAITSGNWNSTVTIPVKATIDGIKDGDRNRKLKIAVRIIGQVTSATTVETCGDVDLVVIDRGDGATCSSVNDPHMKSFDNTHYNNFLTGELVMYNHKSLPYEVRALFAPCDPKLPKGATCNCGAAVRSGDDVITFDTCNTRQNTIITTGKSFITVNMYKNGELTPGTRVLAHCTCSEKYEVILPTGATVVITGSVKPFMNINIQASSIDFESSEGLCGLFNNKDSDDLNGSTIKNPSVFNRQWLRNVTIFKGVPAFTTPPRPTFCSCQSEQQPVCKPGLDVYRCSNGVTSGTDITATLVSQAKTPATFNQARTLVNQVPSRGRRAVDTTNVQNPASSNEETGFTEETALQYCQDYLENSTVIQLCLNHLRNDALNESIYNCAEDLVALNSTEWATAHVDDLIVECLADVQANVTTWENNENDDGPNVPVYITKSLCTQDCGEHGSCENSICKCNDGWIGDTCQIGLTTAPTVLPATETCDLSTSSCNRILVEGNNFVPTGNLTCNIRYITIGEKVIETAEVYTVPASYISMIQVVCAENTSPSSPSRSALVTVSNNGVQYSGSSHIHVVQKSTCQACTLAENVSGVSCAWKPGSCVIDNQCYARYESFGADACYRCDPDVSIQRWTKIKDPNCTNSEAEFKQADDTSADNTTIIVLGVVCGVLALATLAIIAFIVRSRMRRGSELQRLWEAGSSDAFNRRVIASSADVSGQSDAARINAFYNPALASTSRKDPTTD